MLLGHLSWRHHPFFQIRYLQKLQEQLLPLHQGRSQPPVLSGYPEGRPPEKLLLP